MMGNEEAGVQVTGCGPRTVFDAIRVGLSASWIVVRLNGVTFFHAGDGIPWEGLRDTGALRLMPWCRSAGVTASATDAIASATHLPGKSGSAARCSDGVPMH